MIIGIGTDIIEIDRIKAAIDRTPSFLNKALRAPEDGPPILERKWALSELKLMQ